MDWSLIMVRLAIMNEASKKNMISINGMISIRAFLCGNGEPIFMADLFQSVKTFFPIDSNGRFTAGLAEYLRFKTGLFGGIHHHFDVGRRGLKLELKLRG